jgi:hypothetical protein
LQQDFDNFTQSVVKIVVNCPHLNNSMSWLSFL